MRRERQSDITPSTAAALAAAATLVGAFLRIYGLDTTLWIDEISPILAYQGQPTSNIVFHYNSTSNHLLNTLLVRWATEILGAADWVVRLPACVFGIATVPALFAAARLALSRSAAVTAAFCIAIQYHHIFFSQNARGYSAHLLFGVLASFFLVRAVSQNRFTDKAGFVASSWLMTAAIPIGFFTLAAHSLILVGLLWTIEGGKSALTVRSVVGMAGIPWLLSILTYAPVLPAMYSYIPETYTEPAVGFGALSGEFLAEMLRGFGVEPGPLVVVVLLLVGMGGLFSLRLVWNRNRLLLTAMTLPLLLLALFAVATGFLVSPRYFVHAIAPAMLCLAAVTEAVADRVRASGIHAWVGPTTYAAVVAVLAAVQAPQLTRYYRVPKQPFRQAIARSVELVGNDGFVLAVDQAQNGFRYYGAESGLDAERVRLIRTSEDFDAAVKAAGNRHMVAATTLDRVLRLRLPEVPEVLDREWVVVARYPGTIDGGAVTLWKLRADREPAQDGAAGR